jgi:hypothetical protein
MTGTDGHELDVQVGEPDLVVTMPTILKVVYRVFLGELIEFSRIRDPDAPISAQEFSVLSRVAAHSKAQELGWID